MFSEIERVHISGGNFIQNINNRDDNILKHVAFQSIPRSRDAAFSAAINLDNLARRSCTKGTRVDIIAEIINWINENDPAKAPSVYWLTGLAGLGKTTIAYTICEWLDEARLPFASFFCSLQLDSRNSKLLVTTLCRDLAELYDSYAANVLSILQTNSKVVDAGLRIQINELLAKPWQASIAHRKHYDLPTPIVVVDALDELENDRGTEFLEELLRVIHAGQLAGIKFLVTSRPHPKLVNICKSFPPNAICKLHEVDTANVQNDIERYLREALPELKDDPELALLSQRAGGLFIYATTAVRFISPLHTSYSVSEMRFHLQAMLNSDPLTIHGDSDEIFLVDELYKRILGDAFRDSGVRSPRLRILHTIVCAESGINVSVLASLTKIDEDTVKRVVESLHSVLFVSSKDGCVYWYHASFPDFLFSRTRARISTFLRRNTNTPTQHVIDVFCNAPAHHGDLARRCFSIMQESLHFNMCRLPSSYVFDSEVPWLDASVDKTFSATLRYVSRHWARHLLRAVPGENDTDDLLCGLKDFLDNKLLFWIEAMNLLGAKFECSSLLKDAESLVERRKGRFDLLGSLADAANFSSFFAGSPASKSTPHLYISTLSMWNQDSPTWTNWRHRFKLIPSILLPRGAIAIPLLTILTTDCVFSTALSPDGNQIVSGCRDRSLWVWNAKTGEPLRELQGHTTWITSVAFSSDGNRIVSGCQDSVRVWDAKTCEQLRELRGHTLDITSVAFSSDGNRIVSSSNDKSVRVWDANTGEQLTSLLGHTNYVRSVALSSDGSQIISGSWDKSVRVWDMKLGRQLRVLQQGHKDFVTSVTFSPDGNRIVSGCRDKSMWMWDAKTGEQLMELQGHVMEVNSVTFSPDSSRIVSGSSDRSVRVWDAKTGEQLRELQGHTDRVASVSFFPDGNRVVSGSWDKSVRVWDAKMGKQFRKLQGHTFWITSVTFSPDGNRIASGSLDKSLRVWDAKTGKQLRQLQGHTDCVTSVSFYPDGTQIVSGSYDKTVRVWDTKTGEQLMKLQGHTYPIVSIAISPDGNRIVSGSYDSFKVWDAKTGKPLKELRGHSGVVTSIAFALDGNRIVSCSDDKTVRVWDAKTGMQLKARMELFTSVTFSTPDGSQIVSGSYDGSVRVWDVNTWEQLRKLQGHKSSITSVAMSLDGKRIVSSSDDKSVRVWDAKTGEQLMEMQGHTSEVTSVAFSRDGNRIVSGSKDQSVRVWTILNSDTPWVMDRDGWLLSDAERLVWVPSTIRNVLLRPQNTLVLSRDGSATISFTHCKLGTFWHECYTP